jgi:hypothetical protein
MVVYLLGKGAIVLSQGAFSSRRVATLLERPDTQERREKK